MTAVGAAGTVPSRHVTTRQAAFIGVGAMVGAGIFSLLGTAGEVAGSAVWVAFALAGVIAALQGYSFGRLGARYPTAGGLLEYVNQGFGEGHIATVTAWLVFAANIIVTAMVALSFGSYAERQRRRRLGRLGQGVRGAAGRGHDRAQHRRVHGWSPGSRAWSCSSSSGSSPCSRSSRSPTANPALLAPSTYPGARDIVSAVALTFFAFLGFGVVTFTARDLADPGPPAAPGDGDRDRDRRDDLHRRLHRRVRHADRPRGGGARGRPPLPWRPSPCSARPATGS